MEVAKKHNINVTTLVKWRHRYKLYGIEGLEIHSHTRSYQ
ncbi:helix-turn-helix domain-containing protein [Paenibacillus chitinolyticus]